MDPLEATVGVVLFMCRINNGDPAEAGIGDGVPTTPGASSPRATEELLAAHADFAVAYKNRVINTRSEISGEIC